MINLTMRSVALGVALATTAAIVAMTVGRTDAASAENCLPRPWGAPLDAWRGEIVPLAAARNQGAANDSVIVPNTRTRLTLAPRDEVGFLIAAAPAMPEPYIYAGLATLRIPTEGIYRIAVVDTMWIDAIGAGETVPANGFGRGPECLGKHVDFALPAGDAVLQFSGGPFITADVLIVPVP
jgi:hypothetical protein